MTTPHEILSHHTHRLWPIPRAHWFVLQRWEHLLFAHWPLPIDILRPLIPPQLEIDTFDGQAWIGVVPFEITRFRLRGTPLSLRFAELNVRTYVSVDGKPGVWFFSLDAASRFAVEGARRFFHLPYFNARMSINIAGNDVQYHSSRTDRRTANRAAPGEFRAAYRPVSDVYQSAPGSLDHWLTERYCLYTLSPRGRLYRCNIHHAAWPLQRAEAAIDLNTVADAHSILLPHTPPLLHYAHRLDVLTGYLEKLSPSA